MFNNARSIGSGGVNLANASGIRTGAINPAGLVLDNATYTPNTTGNDPYLVGTFGPTGAVAEKQSTPTGPDPSAPQYNPLNQRAIDAIMSSLGQLDTLYNQGLATEQSKYDNLLKQYGDERTRTQSQYDDNVVQNQGNYDRNLMSSVYSGIDSLGGLMSILRGQGAQFGTARDLVGNAVSGTVNRDIQDGAGTYDENATALETALNTFLSGDERRRNEAQTTLENNRNALQANRLTSQQSNYNKLAELYGDAGRTSDAQRYAADAIRLDPQITAAARTSVADFAPYQNIAQTPTLSSYSGATSPGAVSVGGGQGSLGSGVFTLGDFRRRERVGV